VPNKKWIFNLFQCQSTVRTMCQELIFYVWKTILWFISAKYVDYFIYCSWIKLLLFKIWSDLYNLCKICKKKSFVQRNRWKKTILSVHIQNGYRLINLLSGGNVARQTIYLVSDIPKFVCHISASPRRDKRFWDVLDKINCLSARLPPDNCSLQP
jgi:hypothetical protein